MSKPNKNLEKHCRKVAHDYAEKICDQIIRTTEHLQSNLEDGQIIATLYLSDIAGFVMATMLTNTEGAMRNSFLMMALDSAFHKEEMMRKCLRETAN